MVVAVEVAVRDLAEALVRRNLRGSLVDEAELGHQSDQSPILNLLAQLIFERVSLSARRCN